jgi:hypothetical protein
LLHPPELVRARDREQLDPIVAGARHGLARQVALAIWDRVCADATDGGGRLDAEQAQRRFHELAARIAARGGRIDPDVGRTTRVEAERDRARPAMWGADELAQRAPGRDTLVTIEARRWTTATGERADDAVVERRAPPGGDDVDRALAGLGWSPLRSPGGPGLGFPIPAPAAAEPPRARIDRRASGAAGEAGAIGNAIAGLTGSRGAPLPERLRRRLERAVSASLDDVRVHTGAEAAAAAHALGAEAYAIGRDIYFSRGAYDPSSSRGQRLIAHEVAHAVQHAGGSVGATDDFEVSSPGDAHELEAERFADEFAAAGADRADRQAEPMADRGADASALDADRDDEPRIIAPEHGPRLVQPVFRRVISRFPLGPSPGPSFSPGTLLEIDADDVQLFDAQTLVKKAWGKRTATVIPLASGWIALGELPIQYDAKAKFGGYAEASTWAEYGPAKIENIKAKLTAAEIAAKKVGPLSNPLDPLGILPNPLAGPIDKLKNKALLAAMEHEARGTLRFKSKAHAGLSAGVEAGIATGLYYDMFEAELFAGIGGGASADFDLDVNVPLVFKLKGDSATIGTENPKADVKFDWATHLNAYAGLRLTLQFPKIPIIDELMDGLSDWPVIGWVKHQLDKFKWKKEWKKEWKAFEKSGEYKWDLLETFALSGKGPHATASSDIPGSDGFDPKAMFDDLVKSPFAAVGKDGGEPPASDKGPGEGDKPAAIGAGRARAQAAIKTAKTAIHRELEWDRKTRAKQGGAGGVKAASAKAPSLSIPTGGGGTTGSPAPAAADPKAEENAAKLTKRDDNLHAAEKGVAKLETKLGAVDGVASETATPKRNQAAAGFEAIADNADNMSASVEGRGGEPEKFERPEETVAPADEAARKTKEAKRRAAAKAIDECLEKVGAQKIWVDDQIAQCGGNVEVNEWRTALVAWQAKVNPLDAQATKLESDLERADDFYRDHDFAAGAAAFEDLEHKAYEVTDLVKLLPERPKPFWDTDYVELKGGKLQLIPYYQSIVRETFYPNKYTAFNAESYKLGKIGHLRTFEDGTVCWSYPNAPSPSAAKAGRPSNWWEYNSKAEGPTIDHRGQTTVGHWNGAGRMGDRASRVAFYNGDGNPDANLAVVPQRVNSQLAADDKKASGGYNKQVGKNFKP